MNEVPNLGDFCYGAEEESHPFKSTISYFFPDEEELVNGIDCVLGLFLGSKMTLASLK